MNLTTILSSWSGALFLYVVADTAATAYLSVAGDRIGGLSFVVAAILGVVVSALSIILFGYALKVSPSYLATIGMWAVAVHAINSLIGIALLNETIGTRVAVGLTGACLAVALLKPV